MITMVEAVNPQGEILSLPLEDGLSGYVIKTIEGLDPVKATVVSSGFAQIDGTQFQSVRRDERNIILKLKYAPDFVNSTVPQLRNNLYRFFMPKTEVTLRFYVEGALFAFATGRVEDFAAPLFAKEPGVDISIICFNPDFVAPSSVVVPGTTVADTTELGLDYPGTTDTGMVFKLMVNRALSEFMIYNRRPGGDIQLLDFAAILQAGDVVEINTIDGQKRAYLTRAGNPSSILYSVSPASAWIRLLPGLNNIRVTAEGAPIPFTIEYTAKYGGL